MEAQELRHRRVSRESRIEPERRIGIAERQGDGGELGRQRRGRREFRGEGLDRAGTRQRIHDGAEDALGVVDGVGKAAGEHRSSRHQSSPRAMVKKFTRVAAIRRDSAARSSSRRRATGLSAASTAARRAGTCHSASRVAASRAFARSRPSW